MTTRTKITRMDDSHSDTFYTWEVETDTEEIWHDLGKYIEQNCSYEFSRCSEGQEEDDYYYGDIIASRKCNDSKAELEKELRRLIREWKKARK